MATDKIGGYKLVSRLGAGGTGTVFKAFQENLGRTVALKVLHPGYGRNQALVKRFKREIQTSAALNHPHIVKVYDAGQEGDHHYFSMEFIEGRPLREALRGGQKLPLKEATKIAMQMCDALKYFHQRGMIHRDIKPENIMIDAGGNVKLMDFGIVKVQDSTVITQEGSTLGTPRYMSPEMVMGEAQDLRSDLFQLGVVLYEMLAGKCPFDGPTISAIATQITDQQPQPPSLLADQMPPALEAVVFKALEKEPVNRYKDAEEMADALKAAELAAVSGAGGRTARSEQRELPRRVATFKMAPEMVPAPDADGNTVIELPRELNQLPQFLEKSFRSAKLSLEEPAVRGGLILAPLAFIAGLVIIWMMSGAGGNTMIGPLTVVEGLAGLQANWKTKAPGLTEVEVTDAGAPPRRFRNSTETAVNEHTIVIKQLRRGGEYSVRVVHPDGSRSEPVKVTLPTAEKLLDGEPKFSIKEPGTVELSLKTNAPALAHVSAVRADAQVSLKLSPGYARDHHLVLSGIGPDEEIRDMRLVIEGVDERVEENLPPVMGGLRLAKSVRSIIGGLKNEDLEQIATRLDGMMFQRKKAPTEAARATARAKSNEEGKSALRAWLKEKRIDALLSTVQLLHGWAFSPSTDLKAQIGAYESLLRLEDLDYLSYELVHAPLLDVPMASLFKPFVTIEHVTDPGHNTQIVDNLQKDQVAHYMCGRYRHKYENVFVAFDGQYYTQGKTAMVDLSDVSTKYRGSSQHTFNVSQEDLAGADRVRFVFQIANMRTDVYLEVKLNNQLPLRIRPDPTKVHEYDMQSMFMQSDTVEQRSSYVAATVPAKLLEPGKNQLSISCETIPGVAPVMGASLLRAFYRVEPKAP